MKNSANSYFSVYNSIKDIKNLWQEIYVQNPNFSFYQSQEWNEYLEQKIKTGFNNLQAEYWVFKKQIIFPLLIDNKQRIIFLLGHNEASDYLSPIYARHNIVLLKEALIKFCQGSQGYKIIFSKIQGQSQLFNILEALKTEGLLSFESKSSICMSIDTKTDTPTFYDSLSKSARNTYRTACNRIKKQGWGIELSVSNTCLDTLTSNALYKLYRQRRRDCDPRAAWYKKLIFWVKKALEQTGLYKRIDPLTLYSRVCPVFLAQIHINGKLAAFCEGALSVDKNTLHIARVATDKNFYHYSPGQILFVRVIDQIKDKVRYFDLTRGNEDYKVKLGARPHYNYSFFDICLRK